MSAHVSNAIIGTATWASAEIFPEVQPRQFAYHFQIAHDAMQMYVHKTFCPFYTITKMPRVTATVAEIALR